MISTNNPNRFVNKYVCVYLPFIIKERILAFKTGNLEVAFNAFRSSHPKEKSIKEEIKTNKIIDKRTFSSIFNGVSEPVIYMEVLEYIWNSRKDFFTYLEYENMPIENIHVSVSTYRYLIDSKDKCFFQRDEDGYVLMKNDFEFLGRKTINKLLKVITELKNKQEGL